MPTSFRIFENLLIRDWPILCGRKQAFPGPKDKPAYHCCTLIIDSGISFWRTLKCYLWRSRASGPDRPKSKPVVRAHERRANGDHSLVIGRCRIGWTMLSMIALAWQKQLAWLWQAASQPESQVRHVVPKTAFLVGTAILARRSDFFSIANGKWAREKQLTKIFFSMWRLRTWSETFLQRMFLRNKSKRINCQSFKMQMGKKSKLIL